MVWLNPADIVVVTGGSHGLGAEILKEFATKGCQTVSLDIVSNAEPSAAAAGPVKEAQVPKAAPTSSPESNAQPTESTLKDNIVTSEGTTISSDSISAPAETPTPSDETERVTKASNLKPVEAPVDTPSDVSAEASVEVPVESPVEAPVEAHTEALVEAPTEVPVDAPVADSAVASNVTPVTEVSNDTISMLSTAATTASAPAAPPVTTSTDSPDEATGSVDSTDSRDFSISAVDEEDLKPTLTISCDVRSTADLKRARETILEKFGRYPSVIVLNAAIRRPFNSIAESSFEDLQETIDVNLSGVIKCMRTFLPDIMKNKRGFIVTIASALGYVVPKGLGAYGASKAGLIGMHEALQQEIEGHGDVNALLVCPGQLDTAMFADVKTPSETLAPVIVPAKLAKKIVKRVSKARTSTIYSPSYVRYLPVLQALPTSFSHMIRRWSGVDKVYDDIVAKRRATSEHIEQNQEDFEVSDHELNETDVICLELGSNDKLPDATNRYNTSPVGGRITGESSSVPGASTVPLVQTVPA